MAARPTPRPRAPATLVGTLLLMGLSGCIDGFDPDLGGELGNKCRERDSDPQTDVSFTNDILLRVFAGDGMCLPCHDPSSDAPQGYQDGGLDLTSHGKLMAGGANSAADIVIPGQPCSSRLFQKLGPAPPSGSPMPLELPPLSTKHLNLIHDWIAEGAKNN